MSVRGTQDKGHYLKALSTLPPLEVVPVQQAVQVFLEVYEKLVLNFGVVGVCLAEEDHNESHLSMVP